MKSKKNTNSIKNLNNKKMESSNLTPMMINLKISK
jgi:hypothetical protein